MKAAYICLLMVMLTQIACKNQSEDGPKTTIPYAKDPEKGVENMLTDFYTAYITATSDSIPENVLERKQDSIMQIYCTPTLRDSIDNAYEAGMDFDPFLNSQDCEIEMLNSLTVQKSNKKRNLYYVHYLNPGHDSKYNTVELIIAKAGDTYQIAAIK